MVAHYVVSAPCGGWVIMWWVHYVGVGSLCGGSSCGGSLCGGCTMWGLGYCVVGHCVVGARCGGYAMVLNVPNPP